MTLDSQWVGIGLSAMVMLGGTAVNLFIVGRFVGQWSEAMRNLTTTLTTIEGQVEELETGQGNNSKNVSLMDQRLLTVEQATSKFWEMREEFVRMATVVEMTGKRTQEQLEAVSRSIEAIDRRLGSMSHA